MRALILAIVLIFMASTAQAGEKEELAWKILALQAQCQLMQQDYAKKQADLIAAGDRLKAIEAEEKAKAKKEEKKP